MPRRERSKNARFRRARAPRPSAHACDPRSPYTDTVSLAWLGGAAVGLGAVLILRSLRVHAIWPYVLVGIVVWVATLESGVHATIAGVALGLLTPAGEIGGRSVLNVLEHRLHPWSAFVIVPLFALANAGVDFGGGLLGEAAGNSLTWAIALGLVTGKIVGIGVAVWLAVRTGFGRLPAGVAPLHVLAVAAVAGIGFTVSLFIADLAYDDPGLTETAKVGIFAGSLLAGVVGAAVMLLAGRRPRSAEPSPAEEAPRRHVDSDGIPPKTSGHDASRAFADPSLSAVGCSARAMGGCGPCLT